jgi:hypothetical protein
MEASDAAEWLLHAESDLTYAKLGQAEPAPVSTRNRAPVSLKPRDSKITSRQTRLFKEAQARYCPHRSATGTYRRPALGMSLQ